MKIIDANALCPACPPSFLALFDPTVEQVNSAAAALPRVFIFPFLTKADERIERWRGVDISDYIVRPTYIGNLHEGDALKVAQEIIKIALTSVTWRQPATAAERVCDECGLRYEHGAHGIRLVSTGLWIYDVTADRDVLELDTCRRCQPQPPANTFPEPSATADPQATGSPMRANCNPFE